MPNDTLNAASSTPMLVDAVESVYEFNRIGSVVPPGRTFNADRVTFYFGMMCEELAEGLKVIANGAIELNERNSINDVAFTLDRFGKELKAGMHMGAVMRADREELLDCPIDLTVVSLGSAMYQTPNFREAIHHVLSRNMAKFPNGVAVRDPVTQKILKPAGWEPPDLTPYVIYKHD